MLLIMHLTTIRKLFVAQQCLQVQSLQQSCITTLAHVLVQVGNVSASVFNAGQEQHSLPVIMKRLQNITIKRSRGTFNKMSIINKIRATVIASNKRSKADHLRTDMITSGSTTPDILPGADGKPACVGLAGGQHCCQVRRLPTIVLLSW